MKNILFYQEMYSRIENDLLSIVETMKKDSDYLQSLNPLEMEEKKGKALLLKISKLDKQYKGIAGALLFFEDYKECMDENVKYFGAVVNQLKKAEAQIKRMSQQHKTLREHYATLTQINAQSIIEGENMLHILQEFIARQPASL